MKSDSSYHWQEECLSVWCKNDCRGIVQTVTGAGKTMLALKAMRYLLPICGKNLWTFIVVPTRALAAQWNRILLSSFLEESASDKPKFQVYVVNSARYRLARQILSKLRGGADVFLVADECHHYTSAENRKIFEFVPCLENVSGHYYSLGLSATVGDRDSAETLKPGLGKTIFQYSYNRALKEGTLAEFRLIQVALHFQKTEYEAYQELTERMKVLRRQLYARYPLLKKDGSSFFALLQTLAAEDPGALGTLAKSFLHLSYERKSVVCLAKNRVLFVEELLRETGVEHKVLIFSERIEQAELLFERLRGNGYGARIGKYHSKAGKQANYNALERFRNGEIRILITCKALDEGIDVPDAEIGIILSGTGMERQRLQRLGRILRKSDGKETACLYYLFIRESMEEKNYVPLRGESFRVEDWEFAVSDGQ